MSLLHDDVESDGDEFEGDGFNSEEFNNDTVLIGRTDISGFNPSNILPEPAAVLGDITSWLKPTECDHDGSEYQKHLSFRLAGTGDWVYSTAVYQQWHGGPDPGIFWVRGTPGSGKSVLAASMIKKLSQEECPVLYFFFRHTIAANHNARGGFDEDCAQPEGYKMFDDADKFEYLYWGERLATLHEFILNRPPRNKFERWIKWQTSDSNAFAIALAALIISIVVGVLTLGLAGFQAWIAWKAWKEPVSNGNDTVISLQALIEWIRQQEEGQ